uniref:Uncharacterized protein n=1 Tax=Solanum lycopersicum TaxID=4081 RepID=A0A3Q7EBT7_SOLLC
MSVQTRNTRKTIIFALSAAKGLSCAQAARASTASARYANAYGKNEITMSTNGLSDAGHAVNQVENIPLGPRGRLDIDSNFGFRKSFFPQRIGYWDCCIQPPRPGVFLLEGNHRKPPCRKSGCKLKQHYAMKYGTIPIVQAVGLRDIVQRVVMELANSYACNGRGALMDLPCVDLPPH